MLPASAAASRAVGSGRTFEVGPAQTSGLGTIVVDSQPTSADVRLDGIDAGLSTPTTFTGVTPGDHQVSVSIPGFQPWEQTVSVTADATTTVQAALLVALPATIDAEVTVTTTSDAIDGNVSSVAALNADPGPDGGISLREAITAANATAGTKVIRFAPALQGSVITPSPDTGGSLPTLTGGDTWIIGDIDGNGAPDITLDGRLVPIGIWIWSSGDVVSGLNFINYTVGRGVTLARQSDVTNPAKTLADDRLLGNSVAGGCALGSMALGGDSSSASNVTFSGLIFAGNLVTDGQMITGYVGAGSAHDNRWTDMTIASNTAGAGDGGIVVAGADTNYRGTAEPTLYADHNTVQGLTIAHNHCRYVWVYAANFGNSDCAISDVFIRDNDLTSTWDSGVGGIELFGACLSWVADDRATARDSLSHVEVHGNRIQGAGCGIWISAGEYTPYPSPLAGGAADDAVSDIVVADNQIFDSSAYGILATAGEGWGPPPCQNTTLTGLVISHNLLANTTTGGVGIRLAGGISYAGGAPVTGNALTGASVADNTLQGFAQGIWVSGGDGTGAVGNALTGSSSGNSVSATDRWLIAADSDGASSNAVSFAAAEITPTVTSFTPASGPPGTSVSITGTNFTEATAVAFNGTPAARFSVVDDTHMTAKVPAGATTGTIAVTTPGGSGTSAASFTVTAPPKPHITRLSPTSGRRGVTVTITGTEFGAKRGTSYVKFGTTKCTSYVSWSATKVKARVPRLAKGKKSLTVTTSGGKSNVKYFTVK